MAVPSQITNIPAPGIRDSISTWLAGNSTSEKGPAIRSRVASSNRAKSGLLRKRSAVAIALETGEPETLHTAHRVAELTLDELLRRAERFVHGREHHVGEHLRVVWVDRLRRDLDLGDLERPRRLDLHHPAAGGGLDDLVGKLGLCLRHLILHLLDLLHQLLEVHAHAYRSSSTSRASHVSLLSATNSSALPG